VFGDLSDLSDATYARNSGTLTGAPLYLDFRLNRGALTTRIRRFVIVARCANTIDVFNNGAALVRASLMIGGTRYGFSTFTGMVPLSGIQYATIYWEFPYNPATLQPWTVTDFANFSTGTDSIGIEVRPWGAPLRPLAFRIAELALATEECVENRVRSFYATSIGSLGLTPRWFERTMTAGAAANGNYNYLHVFGWFKADGSNFFTVPLLQDPGVLYATGYTATTGEHRRVAETTLVYGGGAIITAGFTTGEMLPALIDNAGIQSQSQPYAGVSYLTQDSSVTNWGQIINTAAAGTYAALVLPVGFSAPQQPDGPLVIELRHGAGAATGGGTLDATMTIQPSTAANAGAQNQVYAPMMVPFDGGPVALLATTAYNLRVTSPNVSVGRGWSLPYLDTRSPLISPGVTQADVEGTSSGGTADALVTAGTTLTEDDYPWALVQAPPTPSGFTATVVPELCENNFVVRSARVRLAWTATALGAAFGAYNVYRRAARGPADNWTLIATINGLRPNATPATVEANENGFEDWAAGMSTPGGRWQDGWDYTVTLVNGATNIESPRSAIASATVTPNTGQTRWAVVSNLRPYLNTTVPSAVNYGGSFQQRMGRHNLAGRDVIVTQTPIELPAREYEVEIDDFSGNGEDSFRRFMDAAALGEPMTLVGPLGELVTGVLDAPNSVAHQPGIGAPGGAFRLPLKIAFAETIRGAPNVGEHNLGPALMLNGTTQYATHADNALIDPLTGPFSIFVMFIAPAAASGSNRFPLAKVNQGVGQGYSIAATAVANQIGFFVQGATSSGTIAETNAAWFDNQPHVAIGTSSGTAQVLYRDGTQVATGTITTGSISNALALTAGAQNGGAAGFWNGGIMAWGYFPRVLTAADALALSRYLLNYARYRPPTRANLFVDLRDLRTWPGYGAAVADLSGTPPPLNGTVIGAPGPRGRPWPLAGLERF